jgi:hypothetical protein
MVTMNGGRGVCDLSCIACAIALCACYSPSATPGAPCGPGGECPSGLSCIDSRCEQPGSTGDLDAATSDAEGDAVEPCVCSGDALVCGATMTTCSDGCSSNGEPHCLTFTPLNGGAFSDADGTSVFAVDTAYDIDVDTGEVVERAGGTKLRAAGTGVMSGVYYEQVGSFAVFALSSLTVNTNGELRLNGTRPTIFIIDGDMTLRGLIDASGGCTNGSKSCAGPGGGAGGIAPGGSAGGCGAGQPGDNADGTTIVHAKGAGGGGFGTNGEDGAGTTGSAGVACGSTTLVPLVGGSGGGHGGNVISTNLSGGAGGGGGGAVQISASGTIAIESMATIDVGGAGGAGDPGTTQGAGGGGAGGAVLLQASVVNVAGAIAANGGGGGGHNAAGDGEDGTRTAVPAKGFGTSPSYKGGDGGAGTIAPTGVGAAHGGGGGGAVGRIRILGTSVDLGAGVISPPPVTGTP